ncbi:hypothetical protein FRC17_008003, partial [Serendipita sp. 399]
NFHALLAFRDEAELEKVKGAVHRLVHRAIALDGTCTGEHGVGIGKKEYLVEELGEGTVSLMRAVKRAIDPMDLLNPGKVIEARALRFLAKVDFPPDICVPRPIFHDETNYVLIMEDLGDLPSLNTVILQNQLQANSTFGPREVATALGTGLGVLHSIQVDKLMRDGFKNPTSHDVIYEHAVKVIGPRISSQGISDAEMLASRVYQSFEDTTRLVNGQEGDEPANVQPVFSMGDLWPASVLVDRENLRLGLIDWEFAHLDLPLSDIAQLLSYLNLYTLAYSSIGWLPEFLHVFITSYISHSQKLKVAWLSPTLSLFMLRHAVILHGREMINVATEKDWGPEGPSRAELVNAGCRYLRLAGNDTDELMIDELSKDTIFGPFCLCL